MGTSVEGGREFYIKGWVSLCVVEVDVGAEEWGGEKNG
jgi:hypothetical protein